MKRLATLVLGIKTSKETRPLRGAATLSAETSNAESESTRNADADSKVLAFIVFAHIAPQSEYGYLSFL